MNFLKPARGKLLRITAAFALIHFLSVFQNAFLVDLLGSTPEYPQCSNLALEMTVMNLAGAGQQELLSYIAYNSLQHHSSRHLEQPTF